MSPELFSCKQSPAARWSSSRRGFGITTRPALSIVSFVVIMALYNGNTHLSMPYAVGTQRRRRQLRYSSKALSDGAGRDLSIRTHLSGLFISVDLQVFGLAIMVPISAIRPAAPARNVA